MLNRESNQHAALRWEIYKRDQAPPDTLRACHALLQDVFQSGLNPLEPASIRVGVWRGAQLVASAACRSRRWHFSKGVSIDGAHVGYVCSHPAFRGQGYALVALRKLMEEMLTQQLLPGVLHCVPSLVSFYAQAAWTPVAAAGVYVEADGSRRLEEDPVMGWDPRPQTQIDALRVSPFPLGSDW